MAKMTFEQYAEMYSSYLEYLNEEDPEKKEPEKKEPEKEPEEKEPEKEPEKKEPEKKEPEKKEPEANAELIEAIKKLTEAMGKPRPQISNDDKVTIEDVIKKII